MGHSRKHPYVLHGGNWKLIPLPPFGCPNTLLLSESNFSPSPSGQQKFPPWVECGSMSRRDTSRGAGGGAQDVKSERL